MVEREGGFPPQSRFCHRRCYFISLRCVGGKPSRRSESCSNGKVGEGFYFYFFLRLFFFFVAIGALFRGDRAAPPQGRRSGPGRRPPAQTGSQRKQPPPRLPGERSGGTPAFAPQTPAFPPQNTRFSLKNTRFPRPETAGWGGAAAAPPLQPRARSAGCEARESGGVSERDKNLIMQRTFLIDYCRVQGWGNAGCQQLGREAEGRAGCGRSLPRAPKAPFLHHPWGRLWYITLFFFHRRIYLCG